MASIVGYGAWIPYARIAIGEIHRVWHNQSLERLRDQVLRKLRREQNGNRQYAFMWVPEDPAAATATAVPAVDRSGRPAR